MRKNKFYTFIPEAFEKLLDFLERRIEIKLNDENSDQEDIYKLNEMIDYLAANYELDTEVNVVRIKLSQKRFEYLFDLLLPPAVFYYDSDDNFNKLLNIYKMSLEHNDALMAFISEIRHLVEDQSLFIKELMEEE